MTADSPQNVRALRYLKGLLKDGSLKFAQQIDAGWGGEAFGKERAAMTIEGNWLTGAMRADYPDVDYEVVELPAGPEGKGTLAFSQCWGVAADSAHRAAGADLVEHLTSEQEQLKAAEAFGVMPSRTSALETYAARHPEAKAFVEAAGYAQGPVTVAGFSRVEEQFDTALKTLRTADPQEILAELQRNGEQALQKNG